MDLEKMRSEIDRIDDEISKLFQQRMDIVVDVAEFKKNTGKTIEDRRRETAIINRLIKNGDKKYQYYIKALYSSLFNLSRSYQNSLILKEHQLSSFIKEKVEETPKEFPESAVVACQGIDGAYSQIVAEKLFKIPTVVFFESFDAVFHAVETGLCKYGVLPIENSSTGSVTQVYDLMKERNFYVARAMSLKVDHCLLAKTGVNLNKIKTIYSHEQAILQCSKFLEQLKDVKVKSCENTAVAARLVAEADSDDVAAISSQDCASLYGLTILDEDIQNSENNYTRFICITKDLEIYPGADKMSVMLNVPHKPGSLFELMSKFTSTGLNLTKLESRPFKRGSFEFMFYFDFEADINSESALNLLDDLSVNLNQFKFLGSYSEKQ